MSTRNILFSIEIKKTIALNYPKSGAMGFFQGTQKRDRNGHGKRAISVRATDVLLYNVDFKQVTSGVGDRYIS